MFKANILLLLLFCVLLSACVSSRDGVVDMRVESRSEFVGVGTKKPNFGWRWETDQRNAYQSAYRIIVSSSRKDAEKGIGDMWDSGPIASDRQQYVTYLGEQLRSNTMYYWRVKIWDSNSQESPWSDVASFATGILEAHEWAAKWITYPAERALAQPIFRNEIVLTKEIKHAFVNISGLGYYELFMNGTKVGDHVLDPGQTNYDDYALYVSYEVSDLLKKGANVLGVMLGNGWYNQDKVWGANGLSYGNPLFICQLTVEYMDGTRGEFHSDEHWLWRDGPIQYSNVYEGEVYDARQEVAGWSEPVGQVAGWETATLAEAYPEKLQPQLMPAIKKMAELRPKAIKKIGVNTWVYDFGQNFAGWVRLQMKGEKDRTVTLKYAEEVFPDGSLDSASTGVFATKVIQTDRYTFKSNKREVWEPRFTYHGFRYVEVTGLLTDPSIGDLTGVVVYSSVNEAGSFACSEEQINYLHDLAKWSLISNLHGVPTDCPAREKCGWLGDAHAIANMSMYNYDMENFWIKYLHDIRSSSRNPANSIFFKSWNDVVGRAKPKGIPFMVAPGKRNGGMASPDWGTAVVQLPWGLYKHYGNSAVLKEFYEDMKTWTMYVADLSTDGIVEYGLGDWCPPGRVVPEISPAITSTVFHYLDLSIMENVAAKLDVTDDERYFGEAKARVRNAFIGRFFDNQNKTFGSQTADAMALELGLVPEGDEAAVSNSIVSASIEHFDGFINTGIFGLSRIFGALSDYGNANHAHHILTKKGYYSFDFMRTQRATTLWEILPVDSFYIKQEMKGRERSLNHPMQGGYDTWFYQGILGINQSGTDAGYQKLQMQLAMVDELEWAKGSYRSGYGLIGSDWRKSEDSFYWDIVIPPNTSAKVILPTTDASRVRESGALLLEGDGMIGVGVHDGFVACEIGSGTYSFEVSNFN